MRSILSRAFGPGLLIWALLSLACGLLPRLSLEPSPTPSPDLSSDLHSTLAVLQTQVAQLQATLSLPIATPSLSPSRPLETPLPTSPWQAVTLGALRLNVPPELALQVDVEAVPAVNETEAFGPWDLGPAHWRARLWDYPIIEHLHEPWVWVYPARDYMQMNPEADSAIQALGVLLNRPFVLSQPEELPHPVFATMAARVFAAGVQRLDFNGGSGIRVITYYAQDITPIENSNLLYEFQGLSADGTWYIVATMPLNHPDLPAADVGVPDLNDPNADWAGYYAAVAAYLERQPATSFTPNLASLDAMFTALQVVR
ncbi:MAG: hypothetical protein N3A60_06070 [Thermanaerothrix sp.]|nr:hypothetical protein [Thermanaerothrix sp.]